MEQLQTTLLENLNEFLGFARKRLRDPELAADAVQESLLKALKASGEIHRLENAKAWFYRILRRTIIDLYRRRDAKERALTAYEQEIDSPPDPEEERIVCGCLARLLPSMAPRYARLIEAIDLKEEPPDQVAADLGIARGNLNVRLHRARQQLKQRLEENCRVCAKHGCLDCRCENGVG
jgi:RNA polymerase sigma-70 factor (ECF subfamily)